MTQIRFDNDGSPTNAAYDVVNLGRPGFIKVNALSINIPISLIINGNTEWWRSETGFRLNPKNPFSKVDSIELQSWNRFLNILPDKTRIQFWITCTEHGFKLFKRKLTLKKQTNRTQTKFLRFWLVLRKHDGREHHLIGFRNMFIWFVRRTVCEILYTPVKVAPQQTVNESSYSL